MNEGRRHRKNYNEPGHVHELTFSCYKGYKFLGAERTCLWLAEAIEEARSQLKFELWAYVFMPEHVHLLLRPHDKNHDISRIRKTIKAPVGRRGIQFMIDNAPEWLPRVTRRRGKKTERLFWQSGGGYDRNVIEPTTLAKMLGYIHMNPVRRGLVQFAADWKWSSAAWYLDQRDVPIALDAIPPEWLTGD